MLNGLIGIFGDSFVRNIKRRELQTAALAAQGGGVVGMDFDGLLEDIKGTLVVQGRQLRGLSKKIR